MELDCWGVALLLAVSMCCSLATSIFVKRAAPRFKLAGITGIDVNKKDRPVIPEALGLLGGAIYLVALVILIPGVFLRPLFRERVTEYISAILSINCTLLLGFADDVLNLPWRYKLLFPTLAALPAVALYHLAGSVTSVKLPAIICLQYGVSYVDLGWLYYVFMVMVVVFCTNAINILAGINGIETGQSLVIAGSILANNLIQLSTDAGSDHMLNQLLSVVIIVPYIFTVIPILVYNWYPASIFVGDTFCYFSGTVFGLAGVLGHFTKTLILFLLPQIFNFVYSSPQLFHLIPCPRHRMPRLNPATGLLETSVVAVRLSKDWRHPRNLLISLLHRLGLVSVVEAKDDTVYINNLTLINLMLHWFGPTREDVLAARLLGLQVASSVAGLLVRYLAARLLYD